MNLLIYRMHTYKNYTHPMVWNAVHISSVAGMVADKQMCEA